jgi:hypothetical protein
MDYLSDYLYVGLSVGLSASFSGCAEPHILHGHSSGEREGLPSYSGFIEILVLMLCYGGPVLSDAGSGIPTQVFMFYGREKT